MVDLMLRSLSRPLRLFLEFLAGFAGALIVLWLLLIWRLSTAPMNLAFLTPYTQTAIADLIPGTQVTVTNSLLTWDNADHSVTLHADGIHLTGNDNVKIADVPSLDIRISVFGLVIGRLVPAGLHIEHPQVWLDRSKDGALLFGGMAAPGSGSDAVEGDMKKTLINIADDLVHAHFMRKLEIKDAVFVIHDEDTNSDWTLALPEVVLSRHLAGELSGDAKIKVTQGTRTALAVVHYNYARGSARHNIAANFSGLNPASLVEPGSPGAAVNVPLTGEVSFAFNNRLDLMGGALDVKGDVGSLQYPDFWDTPRAIKSLEAKADYDRKTGKLALSKAVIDFGGPKLSLLLTGAPPADKTADLAFELSAKLMALPMDDFGHIWPKPIIPGAREWIAASLSKGTFDHGEASFKGSLKWNDLGNTAITEGSGTVSATAGTVNYLEGMPPVTGVSAKGDFDLSHMTVVVSNGSLGDLKLLSSTLTLTDFEQHVQNIDLPIKFSGPVTEILKLIDVPRFHYAQDIGLKPSDVQGTINGFVQLKFPLLKTLQMKDAEIKAGGDMTGLSSTSLVKGLAITEGDLTLALDKSGFTLNGKAAIQKIPLLVTWQQNFNESADKPLRQATLTGDISGEQWGRLGVDALAASQGPIAVKLEVLQKTKKSTSFTGALDMKKALMDVSEIGWKKPANTPATLSFTADMPEGKDINVTSLTAQGPGLSIKGKAVFAAGDLRPVSINLSPFIVGRTDATLHFTQAPGDNGKISFTVEGKSFDVSGLRGGKDPARSDPRPKEYHVKLNKLYTSDFGFVSDVTAAAIRDPKGWSTISLHGLADGGHALAIELTPQPDGHRTFSITCDDFGKALRGLGFTDTVKDGKLKVTGASAPENNRVIDGKVYIGHFEVKDLPALVVLMNATSPFGIFNLFAGTLDFDHLEGKFRWQGDALDLNDVRASGDSVGMTIDGKLDMDSGAADLNGTMAPFSMFNRIIGSIPLIGDMITGGEGQGVLGVTYTIKGTLDKPDVGVNPASLLTPGFLRTLFFGGGSDDDGADENPPPANAPAAKPPVPVPQTESSKPAATNFNK